MSETSEDKPAEAHPPPSTPGAGERDARSLSLRRVLVLLLLVTIPSLVLLTPRPVTSRGLILPRLDHRRLAELEAVELERRARATSRPLSVGVRTVGELLRRVGSETLRDPARSRTLLKELRGVTSEQVALGQTDQLLLLRALQAGYFLAEVRRYEQSGVVSAELLELGGDFPRFAERRLAGVRLSDQELGLLFRVRWGTLTGTHRKPGFGPRLPELRAHVALLLRYPEAAPEDEAGRASERLGLTLSLGKVDPEFPVDAAAGTLLLMAGDRAAAARHLERYVATHPSGPFALSVRNQLLFAQLEK